MVKAAGDSLDASRTAVSLLRCVLRFVTGFAAMLIAIAAAMLAGASSTTAPDTFTARVQRAKMVEAGSTGPAYQKLFWAKTGNPMTDALKSCLASNAPADKSPFTLVADITFDGHPLNVEVRAPTPVAKCLAGQFSTWTFPAPPKLPDSATYPVEIDVSIQ
jgi:hypothetical protein